MTATFFDTPLAQEKREIVKSGVVYQFSFAYDVLEAGPVTLENGTKANELRKLDLFEVSIVPIPANQNAVMTEIKAGRNATANPMRTSSNRSFPSLISCLMTRLMKQTNRMTERTKRRPTGHRRSRSRAIRRRRGCWNISTI